MKKFLLPVLLLFFILGFIVRLYRFDEPIADWHSWRQADTSAVSRILVQDGFDLLHPRYLDISNIQTGKDNPEGYRYVEFPLYNTFQAAGYKILPIIPIEQWGRIVTIFSSLFGGVFLFLFSKKHFNYITALSALFFYMFLPFSIYYGRTILPDTMMASSILGGIYFFDMSISKKSLRKYIFLLLATLFTAASFLLKPYALFFVLPMFILAWNEYGWKMLRRIELYAFTIISLLPLILWRLWIGQFPEGVPASAWLFNEGNIRFKGAFFYWIFGERISKLILGYVGISLVFLGLFKKNSEKILLPLSFLASSLLYMVVMARGNVQHDYYQILIIPTIALFMGRGVDFVFSLKDRVNRIIALLSISFVIFLTFSLSWYYVRDYFNVNNIGIVIAGKKADEILPPDAKVIAPYDGDTTFLYYVNRKGWPAFQDSWEKLKEKGATHLVVANPTDNDRKGFGTMFEIVAQSDKYLILKL